MNNETELIGPHEGQEIALMLAGEKPLALFSGFADDTGNIPDPDFEPHVRAGTFVKREFQVDLPSEEGLPPFRHVLLARPEDTWRIDDAYAILNGHTGDPRRHSDDAHVRMGRLLGYSEEAVAAFAKRCERLRRKWEGRERRRLTA
tara:strand:+ start:323 stop:760 length:438 start_codon:yes stop_codon:yes gene_type:complete